MWRPVQHVTVCAVWLSGVLAIEGAMTPAWGSLQVGGPPRGAGVGFGLPYETTVVVGG